MVQNVVLVHGSFGHPDENWFPWLKSKLEKEGCSVLIPRFTTHEKQNLSNWMNVFEGYIYILDENSILIGHSLGPAFILNILENLNRPVKACFFVSGFLDLLGNPVFDQVNKTFVDRTFNWQKIKENCKKFYVYHSDNDPYVPLESAKKLAKNLGVKVRLIKRGGHLNEAAGFKEFPRLLNDVEKELNWNTH